MSKTERELGGRSTRWVLLSYRVPREPSTPRITIWRKLDRLGVARLGDGLVALPADPRTREQLDWLAQDVVEAGGTAMVWLGEPVNPAQERELIERMTADRVAEYRRILAEAETARTEPDASRARAVRRLRAELRKISRRDFSSPPERDQARAAVEALAAPQASVRETKTVEDATRESELPR